MSQVRSNLPDMMGFKTNRRSAAQNLNGATGVSYAVPSNARWKLWHLQIKLVTTSSVGNRLILVQIRDQNNNVVTEIVNSGTYGTGRTVAATTTERYELTIFNLGSRGVTIVMLMGYPYVMLSGESIFIKDTAAIDATDQVNAEIEVEEWIEL